MLDRGPREAGQEVSEEAVEEEERERDGVGEGWGVR